MRRWSHRSTREVLRWTLKSMGLDAWQLPTVRNMLTRAWSVEGDDLRGLIEALEVLRDAWQRPQRAVDFPWWSEQHQREPFQLENLYLRVAEFVEAYPEPAWADATEAFSDRLDPLELIMVFCVCGQPAVARTLAQQVVDEGIPRGQPWVRWLAGEALSDAHAALAVGEARPLRAALESDWSAVVQTSTAKAKKAGAKPVTNGDKVLVQLARWKQGDPALDEKILRASFRRWFAYAYHRHTSFDLRDKAPYVFLYQREIEAEPPVELVARFGGAIKVLKRPPKRQFSIPASARARIDELLRWAEEAAQRGEPLWTDRSPDGVAFLIGDETPAPQPENSFADIGR